MRRILFATGDRSFSMFLTEALLQKKVTVEQPMLRSPHWDICRAHSALELITLINYGKRQFDIIVVDQELPGPDCLEVIADLRRFEHTQDLPIFIITERGKHQLVRRIAAERYFVSGFIEKPVSAISLRANLTHLGHRSRILIVDQDQDQIEKIAKIIEDGGYDAFGLNSGEKALTLKNLEGFDVLLSSTTLEDMDGAQLCVRVKQSSDTQHLPFVIYGTMEQVGQISIDENAYRADGFIKAPVSPDELLRKLGGITGRARPSTIPPPAATNQAKQTVQLPLPDNADTKPNELTYATSSQVEQSTDTKPPAASRLPLEPHQPMTHVSTQETAMNVPPSRSFSRRPVSRASSLGSYQKQNRATRRVPCRLSVSLMNGLAVHESETLNISNGGIMISTDVRLEMGQHVELNFSLPNLQETINATGKIAWFSRPPARPGEPEPTAVAGIKFSSIKNEHLEAIVNYVNNIAKVVYVAP